MSRSYVAMTERDFQQRIVDYCRLLGLLCYHTYDSRRSVKGFPDLVVVGPGGGLLFAELKSADGKVTADQQRWLDSLKGTAALVRVWRPDDWPEVQRTLSVLAGRTI